MPANVERKIDSPQELRNEEFNKLQANSWASLQNYLPSVARFKLLKKMKPSPLRMPWCCCFSATLQIQNWRIQKGIRRFLEDWNDRRSRWSNCYCCNWWHVIKSRNFWTYNHCHIYQGSKRTTPTFLRKNGISISQIYAYSTFGNLWYLQ